MFDLGDTNLLLPLLMVDVRYRAVFGVRGVVIHLACCPEGNEADRRSSRRDRGALLARRSREPRRCTFRTAWLARARTSDMSDAANAADLVAAMRAVLSARSHGPGAVDVRGARASRGVAAAMAVFGSRAGWARACTSDRA
jgi:hypothetical protein